MARLKDHFHEVMEAPLCSKEIEEGFGAGVMKACGIRISRNYYFHPHSPVRAMYAFTGSKAGGDLQYRIFTRLAADPWGLLHTADTNEVRIVATSAEAIEACRYEVLRGIPGLRPVRKRSYRTQVHIALGQHFQPMSNALVQAVHQLVDSLFLPGNPRGLPLEAQLNLTGADPEDFALFLYWTLKGEELSPFPQTQAFADQIIDQIKRTGPVHGFWSIGEQKWAEIGKTPFFGAHINGFLTGPFWRK